MTNEPIPGTIVTDDAALTEGKNLSAGDRALIQAAATGEGAIALTPDMIRELMDGLGARAKDIEARFPKLVEACDYETRLAVACWVCEHIIAHAKEGGSFRYLIYDRLGFGPDAYMPLQLAGALVISNEFDLNGGISDDA